MRSRSTIYWLGLFVLLGGWVVVFVVLEDPSKPLHTGAVAVWVERMGPLQDEVVGRYRGIHVDSARLSITADQRLELNFGTAELPDEMGAAWSREADGTLSGVLDPVPGTTWAEPQREFIVYPLERALVMSFNNGWELVMFKRDPN